MQFSWNITFPGPHGLQDFLFGDGIWGYPVPGSSAQAVQISKLFAHVEHSTQYWISHGEIQEFPTGDGTYGASQEEQTIIGLYKVPPPGNGTGWFWVEQLLQNWI